MTRSRTIVLSSILLKIKLNEIQNLLTPPQCVVAMDKNGLLFLSSAQKRLKLSFSSHGSRFPNSKLNEGVQKISKMFW